MELTAVIVVLILPILFCEIGKYLQKKGRPLMTHYHRKFVWLHFISLLAVAIMAVVGITTGYNLRGFIPEMVIVWIWLLTYFTSSFFVQIDRLKRVGRIYFRMLGYMISFPLLLASAIVPMLGMILLFALVWATVIVPDTHYSDSDYRFQESPTLMGPCCTVSVIEKSWLWERQVGTVWYEDDGPVITRADNGDVVRFLVETDYWGGDTTYYYTPPPD